MSLHINGQQVTQNIEGAPFSRLKTTQGPKTVGKMFWHLTRIPQCSEHSKHLSKRRKQRKVPQNVDGSRNLAQPTMVGRICRARFGTKGRNYRCSAGARVSPSRTNDHCLGLHRQPFRTKIYHASPPVRAGGSEHWASHFLFAIQPLFISAIYC